MRGVAFFFPAATPLAAIGQTRDFRTTDRMILGTPEDLTASIVFADVDGDGDQDALLANGRPWPQVNEVYLNDGSGRNRRWAKTLSPPTLSRWRTWMGTGISISVSRIRKL